MRIPLDVQLERDMEAYRQEEEIEKNKFFSKCLRAISGRDAYKYFCSKVAETMDIKEHYDWCDPVFIIVNYFFDNDMYKEMSLDDWLLSDNGPVIFSLFDMKKIFPEFKLICKNEHEIVHTANQKYSVDLKIIDSYVYSLSFDWNSFEPIPVEDVRKKILEVL